MAEVIAAHEMMALHFLSHGPHCIGAIDSDDKFAAAIVFCDLEKRGLVRRLLDSGVGPFYTLTTAGKAALAASPDQKEQTSERE